MTVSVAPAGPRHNAPDYGGGFRAITEDRGREAGMHRLGLQHRRLIAGGAFAVHAAWELAWRPGMLATTTAQSIRGLYFCPPPAMPSWGGIHFGFDWGGKQADCDLESL